MFLPWERRVVHNEGPYALVVDLHRINEGENLFGKHRNEFE